MSLFSGNDAARAATDAARTQQLAGIKGQREIEQGFDEAGNQLQAGVDQANQFLNPFQQVGNQALAQSNLLTDPNAQFDFIQNNPMFQASLANANANTNASAAARGRVTSGDTMQQLSNNTMLAAQPLLAQQQANIQQGLNFGAGIAGQQAGMQQGLGQNLANLNTTGSLSIADLLTSIGAAQAGGIVGAQNAKTQAQSGALNAGLGLAGMFFSDIELKEDIKKIGTIGKFNKYSWNWNDKAKALGLTGKDTGVLAQEVELTNPELVHISESGYKKVNYKGI